MIKCPNCGESHYQYHYSVTTAMGWTQVYKDGVLQNSNPNVSTSYCTCCKCGHDFYYTEQYGEVQSIVDQGKKPEVPTLDITPSEPSAGEALTVKAEDVLFMPVKNETVITIPTDKDIEEVKDEIKELKKELDEIKHLIIKWVL